MFEEHPFAKEIKIPNFVNIVWKNPFVWDTALCLKIRRHLHLGGASHLQCK
jgi:hypothetical protein